MSHSLQQTRQNRQIGVWEPGAEGSSCRRMPVPQVTALPRGETVARRQSATDKLFSDDAGRSSRPSANDQPAAAATSGSVVSRRLFTSESVTEGHPDKIADQISDTILDALLREDPHSRVAVETLITTGLVHVAGEVTTAGYVEIPSIVRKCITDIGYDSSDVWFDGRSCGVEISIGGQSPDIAQGVDDAYDSREQDSLDDYDRQGAGDQGIMFGYA